MGKGDCTYRLPCFAPNSSHRRCCPRSSQAAGTTNHETFTIVASISELPQNTQSRNNTPSRQLHFLIQEVPGRWKKETGVWGEEYRLLSIVHCWEPQRRAWRSSRLPPPGTPWGTLLLLEGHIPGLSPRSARRCDVQDTCLNTGHLANLYLTVDGRLKPYSAGACARLTFIFKHLVLASEMKWDPGMSSRRGVCALGK